ncbi:MAG TPA: hypothetical protein GXZ45_15075 [Propionibacterium sp.]|nr:hypothetical protein [Propionibacterium sp.]
MTTEIPAGDEFDAESDPSLQEMADENRPYGEVTAEDLATEELVADGADPALDLGPDDPDLEGVVPVDRVVGLDDDPAEETIEERLKQEEPDPATDIVPER